jgi:hypothetical protein
MNQELFDAIRDTIQIDIGNRGLARDPQRNLFTQFPDDFRLAALSIGQHPKPRVGLVTGFMIVSVDPPTGETDGPLGSLFLARALSHLGIECVLLSDQAGTASLRVGLDSLGLSQRIELIDMPLDFDPARHGPTGLTHCIALERSGPSYLDLPPEHRNRNHTMRARDISPYTAPAHLFFEGERDYVTIGIGDGGNEIGMGKMPRQLIHDNIPHSDITASRIATDHLIVTGISNWGGYALAAGTMLARQQVTPELFDAEQERAVLEVMVERGPLVDGVRGKQSISVDGFDFDDYIQPLVRIRQLLTTES